jgi:hypothetical protein
VDLENLARLVSTLLLVVEKLAVKMISKILNQSIAKLVLMYVLLLTIVLVVVIRHQRKLSYKIGSVSKDVQTATKKLALLAKTLVKPNASLAIDQLM